MKRVIDSYNYTFTAATKTIDFTPMGGAFNSSHVYAILNITQNQKLIYAVASSASGLDGVFTGSVLVLTYNTTSFADTDVLQVIYDDANAIQQVAGSVSVDGTVNISHDVSVPMIDGFYNAITSSVDTYLGKQAIDVNIAKANNIGEIGAVLDAPYENVASVVAFNNGGTISSPKMNVSDNSLVVDVTQNGNVPVYVSGGLVTIAAPINNVQITSGGTEVTYNAGVSDASTPRVSANIYNNGSPFDTGTGSITSNTIRTASNVLIAGSLASSGAGNTDAYTQRVSANLYQATPLILSGGGVNTAGYNILTASLSPYDVSGFKTFSCQITCTSITGGTYIFEGSNDATVYKTIPVTISDITTGAVITSAITAATGTVTYLGKITFKFFRCRVVTTLTGGGVATAYSLMSMFDSVPSLQNVVQPDASKLNVTLGAGSSAIGSVSVTGTSAISAASLPLPTGAATETTLSALNTKIPTQLNSALPIQINSTNFVASTGNSTTSQLASLGTYIGAIESIYNQQAVSILITSDQNVTLILNQYIDAAGAKKISAWTYQITAGVPFSRSFIGNGNYFNLTVSNISGSATTTLQVDTSYGTLMPSTTSGNLPISIDEVGGTAIIAGQRAAALSIPVTLSNENVQDLYITGQSAQTATVNNILSVASGLTPTDANGYRSAMVQVISTGTAGTYIFEGSNDPNGNFQTIPVYNQNILTGTPIAIAITATASQFGYVFPVNFRYIRLRIVSTITGGSIQALTKLMQTPFTPAVTQVAQTTSSSLNVAVGSGTITTVASVTSAGLAATTITDIVSAAITTTTTSAVIVNTNIQTVSFQVACTVVSGTSPTLDLVIQETYDGVNFFDLYHFERITTTGAWYSPQLRVNGISLRCVRTVGGTTPSFTMSLIRATKNNTAVRTVRVFDRTIALNTLSSVTPSVVTNGCSKVQIVQSSAAGASVAPILVLEGSEDNSNFYQLGTSPITVTATASTNSSNSATIPMMPKYVRARVSTAGVGAVLNYIAITAQE